MSVTTRGSSKQRRGYRKPGSSRPRNCLELLAKSYSVRTGMEHPEHNNGDSSRRLAESRLRHASARLGEREREVLEVLWAEGTATVQQVAKSLKAALAYTTVMTTLDRLYKKRLLLREKRDRAFVYRPAISRSELERGRASAMVRSFFSNPAMNQDVLLSCLVDAVQSYDSDLLHRLEEKVHEAKMQNAAGAQREQGGTR